MICQHMMVALVSRFRIYLRLYPGICRKIPIAMGDFVSYSFFTWNCTGRTQAEKWNWFELFGGHACRMANMQKHSSCDDQ